MALFQMDFFIFMLLVLLAVGGACVVFAGLAFGSTKKEQAEADVVEADEALSDLNDMSKSVFKEFDSKYQELLFLYNLIDEKQKKVGGQVQAQAASAPQIPATQAHTLEKYAESKLDIVIDDSKKMALNPKFANVLEMHRNGKTVEEIAKQLDIGKGEISLILTLGKK